MSTRKENLTQDQPDSSHTECEDEQKINKKIIQYYTISYYNII
jgi:hypothetical protein